VLHCKRIGSAKLGIQLAHAGRKASSATALEGAKALEPSQDPWPTIAPSALPFGPGWHTPRAMTEDDMARVRKGFTDAAKRALRAGFDAIELHLAHGYLLHSFVSRCRTSATTTYGGSLAGRMRFPLEVAREVRRRGPRGTPLGARITGTIGSMAGSPATMRSCLPRSLKVAGLDFVDISSGNISPDSRWPTDPASTCRSPNKCAASRGICGARGRMIAGAEQAEALIAEGKADMVAMARAFLDDPHWGWHAAQTLGRRGGAAGPICALGAGAMARPPLCAAEAGTGR